MTAAMWRSGAALSGLILACAGAALEPSPPTNAALAARPGAPAPCPATRGEQPAELGIRLRPAFADDGGAVEVALAVSAPARELRSWRVPPLAGALEVRATATTCGTQPTTRRLRAAPGQLLALTLPAPIPPDEARRVTLQLEYPGARPLLLPGNAFGACFARGPTRYVASLLGFRAEPSGAGQALRVTAVERASPAEAAGLRVDALLRRIEHVPHDPGRPIRLVLEGGPTLEYRGAEARVPGHAWRRVPGAKDEHCRMSGREYPSAR